jgi:hypothetical protein
LKLPQNSLHSSEVRTNAPCNLCMLNQLPQELRELLYKTPNSDTSRKNVPLQLQSQWTCLNCDLFHHWGHFSVFFRQGTRKDQSRKNQNVG